MAKIYRIFDTQIQDFIGRPAADPSQFCNLSPKYKIMGEEIQAFVYRTKAQPTRTPYFYLCRDQAVAENPGEEILQEDNAEAYLKLRSFVHCEQCGWRIKGEAYFDDQQGEWEYGCGHCGFEKIIQEDE